MLICAAGDAHGEFDAMYAAVAALEAELGREVACVLHVGDFGVWPDPAHLDDATTRHGDSGGFRRLLAAGEVPRKTVFIAGNHEDFDYLAARPSNTLAHNLEFLPWGEVTVIEHGGERLRVGGIGGCYGASDYEKDRVRGWSRRHYLRADLQRLARTAGALDVLLLHEPPAGELTESHAPPGFRRRSWTLTGEGQAELVASLRPRLCLTGHLHARTERRIAGVRVVGLHKVPVRGSVIAMELGPDGEPIDLAEWGGAPTETVVTRATAHPNDDPFGERAFTVLEARLRQWSEAVLGGRVLDREGRKTLHARLAHEPLRALWMGALTGADLRALVERSAPPGERSALLRGWASASPPDPDTLRR